MAWYKKLAIIAGIAIGLFVGGYIVGARKSGGGASLRSAYAGVVSNLDSSERALSDAQATVSRLSNANRRIEKSIVDLRGERDRAVGYLESIRAENLRAGISVSNISAGLGAATVTADDLAGLIDRANRLAGNVP